MNQRLDSAGHLMSLLVVMLLASLVTGQNIIDSFEPSDIIANEGGNAIMTCEILSIGSPRIEIRPVGGGFSNVPPDRLETELVVTPEGENNLTRFMYLNVARGEDGTQFRCVYGGSTLSNTGTLDVLDCGRLSNPTNGEVTFIPANVTTFQIGSRATYSCNSGFTIDGDENRFCQNDGTWNGSAPSCQPVDCGPLSIEDGEVSFSSGTTLNSTANYTCFRPFILSGNQERQCQESGLWSGSDPTCEVDSTTGTGTTEPSGDDDDDDDIEDVDIVFIVIGIGIFLLAIVIIGAALLYGYYIWKNDS